MSQDSVRRVQEAVDYIKSKLGANIEANTAVLLGSGLGGLADDLIGAKELSYSEIPNFPVPTVKGHDGRLVYGQLEGTPIVFLKGRVHAYETDDFTALKTMIRTLKALGIETLFTTSSSGSLHMDMPPGSIMAITDHINMMGINPLQGENDDEFGPRFLDMGDIWNADSRNALLATAASLDIHVHEGVYVGFRGPCFETHAEVNMARTIGGHAVGMSAVPEAIVAHHCGLTLMGCAVITNFGAGMKDETLSHDQTLSGAKLAYADLTRLIKEHLKTKQTRAAA